MSRDSKTAAAILSLVDELRAQRSANIQLSSAVGRLTDEISDLRGQVEERNASHSKTTREVAELDARVTRLERPGHAAE
jgi:septal ring factor EnvC (AmiA/AmiB activator)